MLEGPFEHGAAHAAAPVLRQDPRRDVGASGLRPIRKPAARELAVQLREQEQPGRRFERSHLLLGRCRLVRQHASPDCDPRVEVGVALNLPDGDHPDRFSFPCFFAYCSPRRKIASPIGAETTPITSSGQISSHIVESP